MLKWTMMNHKNDWLVTGKLLMSNNDHEKFIMPFMNGTVSKK